MHISLGLAPSDKKMQGRICSWSCVSPLRVEDALNSKKAAVEEGIVVGGGCTLIWLASKVDDIENTIKNDEEKVAAEIVKRALSYPLKLIAKNAGVSGNIFSEKVLTYDNVKFEHNAATDKYEDLMAVAIIDSTKSILSKRHQ